jgi:hypothetical protein
MFSRLLAGTADKETDQVSAALLERALLNYSP